jgi:phosphoesterase RecJ-like protein
MGSAAALCSALRRAGKKACLFPNNQATEKFRNFTAHYFTDKDSVASSVISVDVASQDMLAEGFTGTVDCCIDHHATNSAFGKINLICPEKSACGEIVLTIIENMHHGLTKEEADLLYIAISTDTGCFQYANTNAATHSAVSKLLRYGADNSTLNLIFFRMVSKARILLEGKIYSSLFFHRDGSVVVAVITLDMMQECGATEEDCDDLASLPGRIEGTGVGITIREKKNGFSKVSVRTSDAVSAIEICTYFGGGGHSMAAGCTIEANPQKAKELILAVVDEVYS